MTDIVLQGGILGGGVQVDIDISNKIDGYRLTVGGNSCDAGRY